MERIIVSTKGHQNLKLALEGKFREYDRIREERRQAFELSGDGWHDNPHFNRLQQQEADLTTQLKALRDQIDRAQVLDVGDGKRSMDAVRYGSIVRLHSNERHHCRTWEIVGFDESDAVAGKLSYACPLGQLLIGNEAGDRVRFSGSTIEIASLYASWAEVEKALRAAG